MIFLVNASIRIYMAVERVFWSLILGSYEKLQEIFMGNSKSLNFCAKCFHFRLYWTSYSFNTDPCLRSRNVDSRDSFCRWKILEICEWVNEVAPTLGWVDEWSSDWVVRSIRKKLQRSVKAKIQIYVGGGNEYRVNGSLRKIFAG